MEELKRAHRKAYEKSIKEERCVRVHKGAYYYKGFNISKDGNRDFPWNWKELTGASVPATTKEEAQRNIEAHLQSVKQKTAVLDRNNWLYS